MHPILRVRRGASWDMGVTIRPINKVGVTVRLRCSGLYVRARVYVLCVYVLLEVGVTVRLVLLEVGVTIRHVPIEVGVTVRPCQAISSANMQRNPVSINAVL